MGSAGFPQSVVLIYPASEARLVYFVWVREIPVSALSCSRRQAWFVLTDVEERIRGGLGGVIE